MLGEFDSVDSDSVNYVHSDCPIWHNFSVGRSRVPRIVMFQPAHASPTEIVALRAGAPRHRAAYAPAAAQIAVQAGAPAARPAREDLGV
jgi:hypothetical protein